MHNSDSYSDSSSDDQDLVPIGLRKSILDGVAEIKPKVKNVFLGQTVSKEFGLPPALQYPNLLKRCENILKKSSNNSKGKKKYKVVVIRKNKKTLFNICELAIVLNRDPEHLRCFVLSKLTTKGSINDKGFLLIDGKYVQSELERVVNAFVDSYVCCKSCGNIETTEIIKESRLFFLQCTECDSNLCLGSSIEGFNILEKKKTSVNQKNDGSSNVDDSSSNDLNDIGKHSIHSSTSE